MALTDKITAVADAIRKKTGKTDLLTLEQMPREIESISGDTFCDELQRNNEEYLHYGYAFSNYDLWTQKNIEKLKYKTLKASYVSVVFINNTAITDLSMFKFDFQLSPWGEKPRITYSATFRACSNLVKCMEIDFDTMGSCPNMFTDCSSLVELPVIGVLAINGLDLHWSINLSKASITGIINSLSTTTKGLSVTLSQTAVNNAFTMDEWNALIATKPNWTIVLS